MNNNYISMDDVTLLIDWVMQDLILFMTKKYNIENVNVNDVIIEFQNENIERFKGVHYVE